MGSNPHLFRPSHSFDWPGSFWQVGEGQYLETHSSQLFALYSVGSRPCDSHGMGHAKLALNPSFIIEQEAPSSKGVFNCPN